MAKLYFYYSAMNAGKTTILLQSNYNYRERGMNTLLLTPAIDHRKKRGVIASRIGIEAAAEVFTCQDNLLEDIKSRHLSSRIDCVMVDEAQFLTKEQVLELSDVVDTLHIPVLTYGLRTDFRGEPFIGSQYLLAWADNIAEIKTICHCGRKATNVLRADQQGKVTLKGEQIEIGGNERYLSVCRRHYKQATESEMVSKSALLQEVELST